MEMPDGDSQFKPDPAGTALTKHLLRIKPHTRFPNHRLQFRFIRTAAMMFRLVLDVILYRGFVRTAHAEGITHLPGECDSVFVDPSRRVGLQNLNCFGWGDADRKCNQQMRMISNATCREHRNPMISANSREVFPEPGQHFVWNDVFTSFGAEHTMDEDVRIFVSHSSKYPHW